MVYFDCITQSSSYMFNAVYWHRDPNLHKMSAPTPIIPSEPSLRTQSQIVFNKRAHWADKFSTDAFGGNACNNL